MNWWAYQLVAENGTFERTIKKICIFEITLADDQYEDFALGSLMDSVKTGKTLSRESIMQQFKSKCL